MNKDMSGHRGSRESFSHSCILGPHCCMSGTKQRACILKHGEDCRHSAAGIQVLRLGCSESHRRQPCPIKVQAHLGRLLLRGGATELLRQRCHCGRAGDGVSSRLFVSVSQGLAEARAELQSAPGALRVCGAAQTQAASGEVDGTFRIAFPCLCVIKFHVYAQPCCACLGSYLKRHGHSNHSIPVPSGSSSLCNAQLNLVSRASTCRLR